MAGAAVLDVVFVADAQTEQRRRIDLAVGDRHDLHRARQVPSRWRPSPSRRRRVDQVALVEHDEVGAGDLILEHFLDRDRRDRARCRLRAGAASASRSAATRPSASAAPSTTATTPSTVTRLLIAGQWKACTSGFGSARPEVSITMCSTAGLRDEDDIERRHEIVRHGAAETAVGELDDVLLRAGRVAAALEDFAVDADVAELVHDHRQPSPLRVRQDVADQRRLSGAEKAGDDGAGHARVTELLIPISSKSSGGTRATSPRLSGSGRPRHGIRPSAAPASRRAPATSAGSAGGIEAAEHVGPGAIAANRGAQAALAVRQAADLPHDNAAACGSVRRCGGQQRAGARLAVGFTGMPAGYADVDRRQPRRLPRSRSRLAARIDVTRVAPQGQSPRPRVPDTNPPAPRHPARPRIESTAGLLARGSPPVTAFPDRPSGNVVRARRLQLRGQLRSWNLRSAPHSLFALS